MVVWPGDIKTLSTPEPVKVPVATVAGEVGGGVGPGGVVCAKTSATNGLKKLASLACAKGLGIKVISGTQPQLASSQ